VYFSVPPLQRVPIGVRTQPVPVPVILPPLSASTMPLASINR